MHVKAHMESFGYQASHMKTQTLLRHMPCTEGTKQCYPTRCKPALLLGGRRIGEGRLPGKAAHTGGVAHALHWSELSGEK